MATRGDEIVAVFESPRHAVRAALAIQAAAAEDGLPLGVGIGLDAGEAVEVGDDYRGGALNMAARLCSAGGAGEVLASEPLIHLARAIEGVTYLEGRVERLKGIPQPVRVIEVVPAGRGDAVLRRLRRRARGRRLGRVAVPLAAAAIAVLAAMLVVRGGSDETALADVTRPHTIALFDTGTGKYVKTISTNQDQPEQLIEDKAGLVARPRCRGRDRPGQAHDRQARSGRRRQLLHGQRRQPLALEVRRAGRPPARSRLWHDDQAVPAADR